VIRRLAIGAALVALAAVPVPAAVLMLLWWVLT
jgi:hypothetical protein